MLGSHTLCSYDLTLLKRVRILRKADGDYVQFCLNIDRSEPQEPTGKTIGLDMGLTKFFTDSDGNSVDCPKFLRKAEKQIKREQRKHSRKVKGSNNKKKSKNKLARKHLKVQRRRKDFAVKTARCVVKSNDFVAIEDLQVQNMVKNHHLAKSISDAAWSIFVNWLVYYGSVFGKPVVKVPPAYTSQDCSACGRRVVKSLSERTHACKCGCVLDRDHDAANNILAKGLALAAKAYPGAQGNGEAKAAESKCAAHSHSASETLGASEPSANLVRGDVSLLAEPRSPCVHAWLRHEVA
jgi:putative transposase